MYWENQEIHNKPLCISYRVHCRAWECDILQTTVQVIDTTYVDKSELFGKENAEGSVKMYYYSLPDICEFIQQVYAAFEMFQKEVQVPYLLRCDHLATQRTRAWIAATLPDFQYNKGSLYFINKNFDNMVVNANTCINESRSANRV